MAYAEDQGFIYLHFSDPLKFLIDKTGDAYTNYNYSKTIDMTSTNAKRLYELACKWKDLGKTKMMYIDEWKDFLVFLIDMKRFLSLNGGCFYLPLNQ